MKRSSKIVISPNCAIEIKLLLQIDEGAVAHRPFCRVQLLLDDHSFGDPDAWAMGSLMKGEIVDMVRRLTLQENIPQNTLDHFYTLSSQDLFLCLYEWQWGKGRRESDNNAAFAGITPNVFFALPIGTECFDGEFAYLISGSDQQGRFVWRDYETKEIFEVRIDKHGYLQQWQSLASCL
jgi:hypothetical protein